ncbi:hypothetical protein BH11MYX3_BH11MYX3_41550 [soil metagenome]
MRPLLCLMAAVLLIAGTAHADDREEARKAFAEGQTSDKAEDWQSAIEHYLHAYELVPHHFALYNIARDYERLGQLREASTWYVRYVEVAPPSPDRDKVQKLLVELKVRPAKLTVKSTPSGARVTIDGQRAGVTPYSAQIRGGGHRVAVELDGQRDERDVALEYGEPETVELTLRGISSRPVRQPTPVAPGGTQGTLVVRGQPEGALITIDEVPAGTMPMTIPVAEGQHSIKVTSFGYSNYETTAYVARGSEAAVDVTMSRPMGGVDSPRTIQVGYMLGLGGGADLQGDGALVLAEFGVRVGQGDATLRVGKAFGLTAVDFVVRWALLKTRLSPYFGAGYSYVADKEASGSSSSSSGGGAGWEGVAGLRYDLTRGPGTTFSWIVEIGVRTYSSLTTSSGDSSGVFVPIMTALQVTFGRSR